MKRILLTTIAVSLVLVTTASGVTYYNMRRDIYDTDTNNKVDQVDVLDEDDMVSNSATQPASQQSVKAYHDNNSTVYFGGTDITLTGSTFDNVSTLDTVCDRGATTDQSIIIDGLTVQPAVDSTTNTQFLDADGGVPILNIDSTNERVGIGTATPNNKLQVSGLINFDDTNFNTFLGTEVFNNDDGTYNIGIGYRAGYINSTATAGIGNEGTKNVYIGYLAGYGGFAGYGNNNRGQLNIAIGNEALYNNAYGYRCFALGDHALWNNTVGFDNTGIGSNALYTNANGDRNIAIGRSTLYSCLTGDNLAIGDAALQYMSTGSHNTGIGKSALINCTSGSYNTNIGESSGNRTRGNYNTAIGAFSCSGSAGGNSTHDNSVCIGAYAGAALNGNSADSNTFIGTNSGKSVTTGALNVFIGESSGARQTTNSNLFIIDNKNQGSVGAEATDSLIYGVFSSGANDPGSQQLRFNATTSTTNQAETLGVGATTFAIKSNVMTITGDGGGNTVATITGANSGTLLTLIFVDANITITDTDAHTANTVDLAGTATNLTSADDTTLQIVYDGTSWYEVNRSVN